MPCIELKVVPSAKHNRIKEEAGRIKVYLTVPPLDGRANAALIDFLSDHYNVPKSQIEIIKGLKTRNKVVRIGGV